MSERLTGLILPHAPLLLPEVLERPEDNALARVRAACATAARGLDGSRAVVASPHAVRTGVYVLPYGDLADLGPRGPAALCSLDLQLAEEVAQRWGHPLLDEPLDHGIVVPLLLSSPTAPIVAIGFEDGAQATDDASELAAVLAELDIEATVIASANLSAGVTERAPLTRLPGAEELEIETVKRLEQDATSLLETAPSLATRAGSCSAGPLTLYGRLFGGRSVEVLAHEWPCGVGYLVARTGAAL